MDRKWFSRLAATATAAFVFAAPALADGDNSAALAGGITAQSFTAGGPAADRDRDRDHRDRDWDRDHDDDDWRDRDRDRDWRDRDDRNNNGNWNRGWGNGNWGGNNGNWGNNNRGGAITIYADPGFRGSNLSLNGAAPNLRRIGLDDAISSIRVRQGSWLVCTDPDYRGNCYIIRGDTAAFSGGGINDRISSIRPANQNDYRRYGNSNGGWGNSSGGWGNNDGNWGNGSWGNRGADLIVYVDPDGRGKSLPVSGSIRYLRDLGFNDNISSIQVNSGRWEICSDPDYRGRCRTIDRSVGYTLNIGLNDNISSIRRVGR